MQQRASQGGWHGPRGSGEGILKKRKVLRGGAVCSRKLPVYVPKGNRTAAEKHARELQEEVTGESLGRRGLSCNLLG